MPIGPTELAAHLRATDQAAYDALVGQIDLRLPDHDDGDESVHVPVRPYPNQRVEARVVAAYLSAGWARVEFHDDQRDGPYLVLTRPTKSTADPYPLRD